MQVKGKKGARCFLAVAGGINTPAYLGSRSTFPGGKLGGVQVRGLVKNANLGLGFRARHEGSHRGIQHEALQSSGRLSLPNTLMSECHIRPWGCRYLQRTKQSWTLLTCLLARFGSFGSDAAWQGCRR